METDDHENSSSQECSSEEEEIGHRTSPTERRLAVDHSESVTKQHRKRSQRGDTIIRTSASDHISELEMRLPMDQVSEPGGQSPVDDVKQLERDKKAVYAHPLFPLLGMCCGIGV